MFNWVTIVAENGLSSVWHQAITWSNTDLLSIHCLINKFEILFEIQFLLKKIHLQNVASKMIAILPRLQCVNQNTDGQVQDCSNSSALAMELLQSCTKPSIYSFKEIHANEHNYHCH